MISQGREGGGNGGEGRFVGSQEQRPAGLREVVP
jgi:hypothetical protein